MEIKKNKVLNIRGLSKFKNNIIAVYVPGGREGGDNI